MLPARLREKHFDRWLPGYLRHVAGQLRRAALRRATATCCSRSATTSSRAGSSRRAELARERVQRWTEGYPRLAAGVPRRRRPLAPALASSFPGEEYAPEYLDGLAQLARAGLGEVELHLHHDNDTAENLRREITDTCGCTPSTAT